MRRPQAIAAVVVLAGALLAAPAASAQAPTKTPGELVVGLSMPAAGFQVGAVRGRDVLFARGFEIDLARALARDLAIPGVRFVNDERFSTLLAPGRKDWDLALAEITITAERSERFAFSRPYFRADQGVLLRRGLSLPSRTLAALRGLRLCAERGSTGAAALRRDVRPTRKLRLLRNFSRLEADLYQRRCDAAIADAPQLGVLRAQAPDRVGALAGRIATGERYGIAFEPGSALRPLVDGALTRLDQDGTLARLARRWLTADVSGLPVLR
jgi:polar amino acid transport system substrate-binding protein